MTKAILTKTIVATLFVFTLFAQAVAAETRIASWNIKRMTSENKDYSQLAVVGSYFDFIAVQEIMDQSSALKLATALQERTGTEWGVMKSHAIGRGSYKEHYAFIWRKSHVSFMDSAIVYLDRDDVFAREPLSARFKTKDGETFIAANVHILYGDSKSDRTPEIRALTQYWQWLGDTFPEEQFFLMGDFNMPPDDPSFAPLRTHAVPLIRSGATTLSPRDNKFVSLYDNIWVPKGMRAKVKSGILNFPDIFDISHQQARDTISDHAPVYMILDDLDETSGHYNPSLAIKASERVLKVRGNKNSKIYHLPSCGSYQTMAGSSNLVTFETERLAQQAGYRVARNC